MPTRRLKPTLPLVCQLLIVGIFFYLTDTDIVLESQLPILSISNSRTKIYRASYSKLYVQLSPELFVILRKMFQGKFAFFPSKMFDDGHASSSTMSPRILGGEER